MEMEQDFRKLRISAYGDTWVQSTRSSAGKTTPGICKTCGENCGHDFFSFSDSESYQHTEYTLSDGRTSLAQRITEPRLAQLLGLSLDFWRLVNEVAQMDPMASEYEECVFCSATADEFPGQPRFIAHDISCLWRRAKTLLAEAEERPPVCGKLGGSYDDARSERLWPGC